MRNHINAIRDLGAEAYDAGELTAQQLGRLVVEITDYNTEELAKVIATIKREQWEYIFDQNADNDDYKFLDEMGEL